MSQTIQELWSGHRNQVLPLSESLEHRKRVKQSFYAGAQGIALELTELFESGVSDDEMLAYLDNVSQESGAVFRGEGVAE